jgi:subtilase family serine protease
MRDRVIYARVFVFVLLGTMAVFESWGQGLSQNPAPHYVSRGEMTILRGNVHAFARSEAESGRLDGAIKLRPVLVFGLSAGQQQALGLLLAEQQDPSSASYHKWLTPEQYASHFGISESNLRKVQAWLDAQGFAVGGISRGRTRLSFTGTVAQIEAAFHIEMHSYLVNGKQRFANSSEPSIPVSFSQLVRAIQHLHNFPSRQRARTRRLTASSGQPHFTSYLTGSHFLSPADFATIYGLEPLYAAGLDGTGETIAVMGQTTVNTADVQAFRRSAGLPALTDGNFLQTLVPGTGLGAACPSDLAEAALDVEWTEAIAKNATVNYVYSGLGTGTGLTCDTRTAGVFDSLEYAIDNDIAPVLSISYGNCEAQIGTPAEIQGLAELADQANSQGQTIVAASGDDGAADCDAAVTSAAQGLAVDIPAALPEVTAVGGTEFSGDVDGTVLGAASDSNAGSTTYWSGTADGIDAVSSALSYIPEVGWNDTGNDIAQGSASFAASGGGPSSIFSKPSWQAGIGVPSDGQRDVPDLSFSGSADHDGYLICEAGSCVDGFRNSSGGNLSVVGGTSIGAQAFAGILAIINQATKSSQGNVNPTLYNLAATMPAAFHDITEGSNIVPCTQSTANCPTAPPFQIGFTAGTGYDQVTGLGTVDANNLVTNWPGFTLGPASSSTTLSILPESILAGTPATFTAVVAPPSSNAPMPTGTVEFTVDGANEGQSLVGNGGMANLTDTSLGVGTHTVVAVYSGDVNYSGSASNPVSATVSGTYALTASPTDLSTSAGGSSTSTITVTSTNGFTGIVNLDCAASSPNVEIDCTLNPPSVGLNSTTPSQASTLTISTKAATANGSMVSRPSPDSRSNTMPYWLALSGGVLLAGAFVVGLPSGRSRRKMFLPLIFYFFLCSGVGCGAGRGATISQTTTGTTAPSTPPGTYTITVAGTSGVSATFSATANVSVAVH